VPALGREQGEARRDARARARARACALLCLWIGVPREPPRMRMRGRARARALARARARMYAGSGCAHVDARAVQTLMRVRCRHAGARARVRAGVRACPCAGRVRVRVCMRVYAQAKHTQGKPLHNPARITPRPVRPERAHTGTGDVEMEHPDTGSSCPYSGGRRCARGSSRDAAGGRDPISARMPRLRLLRTRLRDMA